MTRVDKQAHVHIHTVSTFWCQKTVQTVWTQIWPDRISFLPFTQTVWNYDCFSKWYFEKDSFNFFNVSNIVLLYIYYLQTVFVPKSVLTESQTGSGSKLFGTLRPKEKYALLPITCPKILGSVHVGRQTFFKYKILKDSLKIDINIQKVFKKVWVGTKI